MGLSVCIKIDDVSDSNTNDFAISNSSPPRQVTLRLYLPPDHCGGTVNLSKVFWLEFMEMVSYNSLSSSYNFLALSELLDMMHSNVTTSVNSPATIAIEYSLSGKIFLGANILT